MVYNVLLTTTIPLKEIHHFILSWVSHDKLMIRFFYRTEVDIVRYSARL